MAKKNKPINRPQTPPIPTAKPNTRPATTANYEPNSGKRAIPLFAVLSLILSAVCMVLYFNTLQHGFVLDDLIMVQKNSIVAKGFEGIMELLTTPHMRGYLVIPNDTYRPLSLVMFAIERGLFGVSPMAHHFFNIVVYALCCITLFKFLHRFMEEKYIWAAFAGAMLFAVHPVHTDVVANIKSRDELLCFLFAFWGLNRVLNYLNTGKMTSVLQAMLLFYLSFISKENVISYVGVVPFMCYFFKKASVQQTLFASGSIVVAAVVFIIVRKVVLDAYDADSSKEIEFIDNALVKANFMERLLTSVVISGKYLQLLFVPYPLVCNYSYNAIPMASLTDVRFWVSFSMYSGLIYVAVQGLRQKLAYSYALPIGFFLMTIALFNNMFILIGAEMGERFLFIPSAGVGMALAFFVKQLIDKHEIRLGNDFMPALNNKVAYLLLPLCVVFSTLTIARNKDWADNLTLYKADLPKSPNDCRLQYYIGTAMAEELYVKETDEQKRRAIDSEALGYIRKAISMYPHFAEANAECGRIYDRLRMFDSAEYYDKQALLLNPKHSVAMNNLGSVYLESGKYKEAIETFRQTLAMDTNMHLAYFNLARTYLQMKAYDSVAYYYHVFFRYEPDNPDAHQELGMAYYFMGNGDSAAVHFRHVLKVRPEDANAINNLGAVYLNKKMYKEAIEQFGKSLKLNPNYVNAYSNIGRAYYFNHQYNEAINAFSTEMKLDPKAYNNIPYIALSYQALGNMAEAKRIEAIAQQYFRDFKLN